MSCVEGAVVAQVPEPNQYWEHVKSGDRVYFIGRTPDGEMVWQCEGDTVEISNLDWSGWRHIPGCTCWDWEPDQAEEFPQYYVGTGWVDATAYVLRSSPTESHAVDKWGTEFGYAWDDSAKRFVERGTLVRVTEAEARARIAVDKAPAEVWPKYYVGYQWNDKDAYIRYDGPESSGVWVNWHGTETVFAGDHYSEVAESVESGSWRQVTEAEAKARVTKAIEPEMEWVDLPGYHVLRKDVDWVRTIGSWEPVLGLAGKAVQDLPLRFARCRRKDLPVVESPEDWVTQDRVEARPGIDQGWWSYAEPNVDKSKWSWWPIANSGSAIGRKHGHVHEDGQMLNLRCKRKDLPPVPAPVEETFPQWYILKDDERRSWVPDWTIKRTGEETAIRYARDEAGELYATAEPWTGATDCWERCSEAEAMEFLGNDVLPAVPSEPRLVPVKLWVTYRLNDEGGDWPVRATQADQTCQNWKEIKFDGNGAFIEVEQ